MQRFFNLDNPVWRFVGNIADMFILSIYWYLCCLPIITVGSSTAAIYYVTLKLTSHQEGYTTSSFWRSFRGNLKQGTVIWLIFLGFGLLLGADFYWSLTSKASIAASLLPAFIVVAVLYSICLSFIFPLLARCENNTKALLGMCFALSIRNFLPVLSTVMLTAGIFLVGIFIFWPLLLIAPGLAAYLNSYIFNRIFLKYRLNLPD